ncbi:Heat shock protein sti1-like protein [Histomonas meleagridis]|uniref:Heat shock protein sti1-like protein n=1 Tax=Histomonas meleagridis TaxID=135588 RepID=UPI00355A314D|nr:Heat shock protein sti1-like protein [Histomonas meleagridis]KAH0803628.1 Heat shock protein sti1-like protein [Histomonas meleagridis]
MAPPELSPLQISHYKDESISYFTEHSVTANQVRRRHQIRNPANLLTSQSHVSPDLFHPSCLNSEEPVTNIKDSDLLIAVGQSLRSHKYDEINQICESHKSSNCLNIFKFIGFISSIISESDEYETKFYEDISNLNMCKSEIPHYTHLLDEIHLISQTDYPTPLMELILGDITDLRHVFNSGFHLIPKLTFSETNLPIDDSSSGRFLDAISQFRNNLPPLEPIGEGIKIMLKEPLAPQSTTPIFPSRIRPKSNQKSRNRIIPKSKEESDVLKFIAKSNWPAAISLATEMIEKNPDDPEIYLHRAFALINCYKIQDAILDCTRSLKIKKTDKALQMRASFWLMLGDSEMCKNDLNQLESKSNLLSVPPQRNQMRSFPNNISTQGNGYRKGRTR